MKIAIVAGSHRREAESARVATPTGEGIAGRGNGGERDHGSRCKVRACRADVDRAAARARVSDNQRKPVDGGNVGRNHVGRGVGNLGEERSPHEQTVSRQGKR